MIDQRNTPGASCTLPDLASCAAGNGERRAVRGEFHRVVARGSPRGCFEDACVSARRRVIRGSGRDSVVMRVSTAGSVRRARSARPYGAVVTAAGPQMRAILHELALPTFHRFARRWGYAVLAEDLSTDGAGADPSAQQAKWAKIGLLREALATFPLALWLDADILLTRDDEDPASHLHPDHFQALVMEQVPCEHRVNPNTGVWLLRSCPAAFAFLDAVGTAGPQPGPWADQGAVLAALDWDRGDERYYWARPGRGNQFLAGTSWLPPGWNQPYLGGRRNIKKNSNSAQSYPDRPVVSHPHALHFRACHRPRATDTWPLSRRLSRSAHELIGPPVRR